VARGLAGTTGLVTATPPLDRLGLVPPGELVFGGHDVREDSPVAAARALADAGVVPHALVGPLEADLEAFGARVRPGVPRGASRIVHDFSSAAAKGLDRSAAAVVEQVRADLRAFKQQEQLDRVVVVHLASTEPRPEPAAELDDEAGVRALLTADDPRLPASTLYALAAIEERCAHVNFTPSLGATPRGVQALAERRGVPVMGNDGKTGQTLLRTALAPMFLARNLKVLSWSGFNILGNRDGAVLEDPGANAAKTTGKDKVLGSILGDSLGSSLTRIDFVPSLNDWKTAWDFIHFEGFLGTKMSLDLTWRGADSALAAPLVLDLVRLVDLAMRKGRSGVQAGLACFFKAPLGTDQQAFPEQMQMLHAWAAELA
jgi:myo-inositol-1-phosphate synthase